ncbi:MAG: ATP-binding protein [Pseudomonadota bacterium]
MPDAGEGFNSVAPLRTVHELGTLITRLQNRAPGLAGMGCLSGWSGFGKTSAALWATNRFGCVNVQVQSSWSAKFFCERVLIELGERAPRGTVGSMVSQITEMLAIRDTPLLIDEADYLMKKRAIEIVRDIYEGSQVPVILIGEEKMPVKLAQWDRIHNRVGGWAQAQEALLEEVHLLARIYAPGIEIDDALAKLIHKGSRKNFRRICTNLSELREISLVLNKTFLTREDWGDREVFAGVHPDARAEPS